MWRTWAAISSHTDGATVTVHQALSEDSSGRGGPETPHLVRSRSSTTLSVEALRRDASHLTPRRFSTARDASHRLQETD
jgi:hypothetical protein